MSTEHRIELLERELNRVQRRYRLAAVVVPIALLLFCGVPTETRLYAPPPDSRAREIRTTRILIEDEMGQVKAEFGKLFDGAYGLELRGKDGKVKLRANADGLFPYGSGIVLFDSKELVASAWNYKEGDSEFLLSRGTDQVRFAVSDFLGPTLDMKNKKGESIGAIVGPSGPVVSMVDSNRKLRLAINGSPPLGPYISVFDEQAKERLGLGMRGTDATTAAFRILGADGKVLASQPAGEK